MTVMDLTSTPVTCWDGCGKCAVVSSEPVVSADPEAWATAGSQGDPVPADEERCDCGQTGCTAWVVKAEAGYVVDDDDGSMT